MNAWDFKKKFCYSILYVCVYICIEYTIFCVLYTCACTFISFYMHVHESWGTIKRTSDLENERKQERKKKWESDWVYWFGMIAKRIKNIIYRFLALNIFCTIDRASILRIIQYDLTLFIEFYFCHSLQPCIFFI